MRFNTLLIANRGEIALRILRTARQMGLRTVAVYSDADADARHVREADMAVRLGPADAGQSYRNIPAILDACARSGAQAVHPGYGFLSENATFAQAVVDAGLTFVGPTARVIDLMGNKAQAKAAMQAAGVPTVPGAQGCSTDAQVLEAALNIGFPLILKAAAGGGGRGMRVVHDKDSLPDLFHQARSEALGAFGSDEIIIERAIGRARHIEIQVLCDEHGQRLHLGERDCSTQRRFQKVIEEAPSPAVSDELRHTMGSIALKACEAIGYTGVGTLEFLLGEDGAFYFMEMNTRLQVEHGVTELITGLDLVEQQLRVAQGYALGFGQEDIRFHGHAMELRLCAEDPASGFVPQVGPIGQWRPAPEIRVDSALESGTVISPYYDSMVAKLLAWAPDRAQCLQKLTQACDRTVLLGTKSNLGFLSRCLQHPVLREGRATTAFLGQEDLQSAYWQTLPSAHALLGAALVLSSTATQQSARPGPGSALHPPVELLLACAMDPQSPTPRTTDAGALCLRIERHGDGSFAMSEQQIPVVQSNNETTELRPPANFSKHHVTAFTGAENSVSFAVDGLYRSLAFWREDEDSVWIQDGAVAWRYQRITRFTGAANDADADIQLRAPMSCRVVALPVVSGDVVDAGQTIAVVESMKMEMPIVAKVPGVVGQVFVDLGSQLASGQILMEVNPI